MISYDIPSNNFAFMHKRYLISKLLAEVLSNKKFNINMFTNTKV